MTPLPTKLIRVPAARQIFDSSTVRPEPVEGRSCLPLEGHVLIRMNWYYFADMGSYAHIRLISQAAMRRMEYMCRYMTNASLRRVRILSSSGSRWSNPMNSV